MSKTDLTDRILKLLEANGRVTNAEIARRLGVSEAIVRQRLNRAFKSASIRRGVVVDFSVLGIEVVACLHIDVLAKEVDRAAQQLAKEPATGLVISTMGPHSIFAIVATRDTRELAHFIDEVVRPMKGFLNVEVSVISEALKYDARQAPIV